jgi:hypothetical protein
VFKLPFCQSFTAIGFSAAGFPGLLDRASATGIGYHKHSPNKVGSPEYRHASLHRCCNAFREGRLWLLFPSKYRKIDAGQGDINSKKPYGPV